MRRTKYLSVAITALLLMTSLASVAQRQMERLDRGLVAVKVASGVFLSWRVFGNDPKDVAFNVYRGTTKVNANPITGATNITDAAGTTTSTYTVRPVIGGTELADGASATVWPSWINEVNLQGGRPSNTHRPNDINVGDLDGDGNYELILKWYPDNAKDNSQTGATQNTYLAAYKLDGSRLWIIDLGINIRSGAHYTQHLVADFDGDGRAEVMCKTAPRTVDGLGKNLSTGPAATEDQTKSYRDESNGIISTGPEYLTVFNGQTGKEMATVRFLVARGVPDSWGKIGDIMNRVDRYNSTIAYLDGKKPSAIFERGYYHRLTMGAWDWDGITLRNRWIFNSDNAGSGAAYGQGNHSIMAADVDSDGFDEILTGPACIDHDGKFKWATGHGHGDANHVGDLDPSSPGLEVWEVSEHTGTEPDHYMIRASDGKVLWGTGSGNDNGRGMTGDIDAKYEGSECWSAKVDGTFDAKGNRIATAKPGSANFRIYWDGDLLDEIPNGNAQTNLDNRIEKWNGSGTPLLVNLTGYSCNGTKATPNLVADIIGDWREEIILHDNGTKLYIHTTTTPTANKMYTLMHDPVYRNAISWQQSSYNQPPHLGFWLGAGVDKAPVPNITFVPDDNNKPVVALTSPADASQFTQPASVEMTATATDSDGSIVRVEFLNGIAVLGSSTTQPYSFTWTGATAGTYSITARATDDKGATTQTAAVSITVLASNKDCFGVVNGTATIDQCGVCSGGTTGKEPCTLAIIEAEEACSLDGTIDNNNAGFSGSGFANLSNIVGSFANFTIFSPVAQQVAINVVFANGSALSRPTDVIVNGTTQVPALEFAVTGAWTTWASQAAVLNLDAGKNAISFVSTTATGGPNIDKITFNDMLGLQLSCTQSLSLQLKAGWNLIGCPLDGSTDIATALASIWTEVETVKNLDSFYSSANNEALNSLKSLQWGHGYMVRVKTDCVLTWK